MRPAERSTPRAQRPWFERPLVAALVLSVIYVGVSLLLGDHGSLGTDTGGKVATLETMVRRGTLDPDLGYWAESMDPRGEVHPLYYTGKYGDAWVNATTLPMLYAARPLYELGGYRLALLLPMGGAVAAALAARSLASRLGAFRPAKALWTVGLLSPLVVYALDFWEHTIGVALLAWAAVLALDVVQRGPSARRAMAVGALIGAAFTMRTEALVYGFVIVAAVCLYFFRLHRVAQGLRFGATALVGTLALAVANHGLEVLAVGQGIRFQRSAGTAAALGASSDEVPGSRVGDALMTTFNLRGTSTGIALATGILAVGCLATFVLRARRDAPGRPDGRVLRILGSLVAALYLSRIAGGLGFVPGFLVAAPLSVAAIALAPGDRERCRVGVVAACLAALPLVWWFQYVGGAAPQWAGRYLLPSTVVLVAVGTVRLTATVRPAALFLLALSGAVTIYGVAWLVERSRGVERMERAVAERPEDVLISTVGHLFRESGAVYDSRRRWLTAIGPDELDLASRIAQKVGARTVGLIRFPGRPDPSLPGFRVAGHDDLPFIVGSIDVTRYVAN